MINKGMATLMLLLCTMRVEATALNRASQIEDNSYSEAVAAQAAVENSAALTMEYRADIEQLQQQNSNLQIYRDHLQKLTKNQSKERRSLAHQINQIQYTRQGIVPLMYAMLDGLAELVAVDRPIRTTQRLERIEGLRTMMQQADVSDEEKYRRILEAWQIEMDYGSRLGSYSASLFIDAKQREVEVFYLGRIALLARSFDGQRYWYWDTHDKNWHVAAPSQHSEFEQAYALAKRQITPSMLVLPISANGATQ